MSPCLKSSHLEARKWHLFTNLVIVTCCCRCCSITYVWLFVTPWTTAHQASLSLTISQSLPKFMSIASVMPSSHLILWHPLLLLPSIFSSIKDFANELAVRIRWPKYWSFSFSIIPSIEYLGLISFKTDWFDLLSVQEALKSLLQHHSSKVSILLHSAFFTVRLSQLYMTTRKIITLTKWTSVDREMSLLFNTLLILWHFQAPWT